MLGDEATVSDARLIADLRDNKPDAWRLFRDRYDPVMRFVVAWKKWGFPPEVRDDVAQATWADLMTGVQRFRGDCSLEQFVKKVCVLRCLDQLRKSLYERDHTKPLVFQSKDGGWVDTEITDPDTTHPVDEIVRAEKIRALRDKLRELKEDCRKVIDCFYERRLSYKEIARELNIAVNTVGSKLSKCLGRLRKLLVKHPVFEEKARGKK